MFCLHIGVYVPLLDVRRYVFDLTATLSSGSGSKTATWRSYPSEHAHLRQVSQPGSGGWRIIPDPSQFLSFETVARPSRKRPNRRGLRNVGVGNVRLFNPELYYVTLLIEVKLDEHPWSKTTGGQKYQHAATFRLHTAKFEIHYGSTVDEHKCYWFMAPNVESDGQLLQVQVALAFHSLSLFNS